MDSKTIDHLDKVELKLTFSSSRDSGDRPGQQIETTLIYGIGVEGVTPFEKLLFGKSAGEELTFHIEEGEGEAFWGHLGGMILHRIELKPPLQLKVTVLSVETADQREVIQAMARMVDGCAGGCDCGCGCG